MKWLMGLLLVVGIAAGGWYVWTQVPKEVDSTNENATFSPVANVPSASRVVCVGMVEAVDGVQEIGSEINGRILQVTVRTGDSVEKGQLLAEIDGEPYAKAIRVAERELELARARLQQVRAGHGAEEIEAARLRAEAISAELKFEEMHLERLRQLAKVNSVASDELEEIEGRVARMKRELEAAEKMHQAMVRGPLPEEIAVAEQRVELARAKLAQAQHVYSLRFVRAPSSGTITEVCRHAGEFVSIEYDSPIVKFVDGTKLRLRIEIDEMDVPRLTLPVEGTFTVRGNSDLEGRLTAETIVPVFGPKRLFEPDRTARMDTRTLCILAHNYHFPVPLHHGQRIRAVMEFSDAPFDLNEPNESSVRSGVNDETTRAEPTLVHDALSKIGDSKIDNSDDATESPEASVPGRANSGAESSQKGSKTP